MKNLTLIFFLLLASSSIQAQSLTCTWANNFGSKFNDFSKKTIIDPQGNIYSIGIFRDTLKYDSVGIQKSLISNGIIDFYITKYDSLGSLKWFKHFGGSGTDYAIDIAFQANSNLIISGYYENNISFGNGSTNQSINSQGNSDIFVLSMNTNGSFNWVKSFGDASNNVISAITVDYNQNIYLSGSFYDSCTFSQQSPRLFSRGSSDVFVLKLNSIGTFSWAKSFGGPGEDQGIDMSTSGNKILHTGTFQSWINMNPSTPPYHLVSQGQKDIFIQQLDLSGNLILASSIGDMFNDTPSQIEGDNKGNLIISGNFAGSVDFDISTASQIRIGNLISNGFIVKIDSTHSFKWVKTFQSAGINSIRAFSFDYKNNILITGDFENHIYGTRPFGNTLSSNGAKDVFIMGLDSLSNFNWGYSFGNNLYQIPKNILAHNNSIIVTGNFDGNIQVDSSTISNNLYTKGALDNFIISFSRNQTTSIENSIQTSPFNIFPNPSLGKLNIYSSFSEPFSITLKSLDGKVFFKKSKINQTSIINLPEKIGMYFLILEYNNKYSIHKVLKQ